MPFQTLEFLPFISLKILNSCISCNVTVNVVHIMGKKELKIKVLMRRVAIKTKYLLIFTLC